MRLTLNLYRIRRSIISAGCVNIRNISLRAAIFERLITAEAEYRSRELSRRDADSEAKSDNEKDVYIMIHTTIMVSAAARAYSVPLQLKQNTGGSMRDDF